MVHKLVGFGVYGLIFAAAVGLFWVWQNWSWPRVDGGEMVPTIKADSYYWVYTASGKLGDLRKNDIVRYELHKPGNDKQMIWYGRIIAMPGEKVKIVKGEVFVNGSAVRMDYVPLGSRTEETLAEISVPRDTVYILHDNRKYLMNAITFRSFGFSDSRGIGPIGIHAIVGKY